MKDGSVAGAATPRAEAYRVLRASVDLRMDCKGKGAVLFTGLESGAGNSTTVANLGMAYARAGESVTLVDLDLRRPSLAAAFGIERSPGVTDVLLSGVALEDAIQRPPRLGGPLAVLPAGSETADPGGLVASRAVADLLAKVLARGGHVLIDAPPILAVGDALALSAHAAGIVLVARVGAGSRSALSEATRVISSSPAFPLGVVASGVPPAEAPHYP
jgi:capsular exopolysaccharide synthesis family protein